MPTYRTTVDIYVTADDESEAEDWIVHEVFPLAQGDTPIFAVALERKAIIRVNEETLEPMEVEQ